MNEHKKSAGLLSIIYSKALENLRRNNRTTARAYTIIMISIIDYTYTI